MAGTAKCPETNDRLFRRLFCFSVGGAVLPFCARPASGTTMGRTTFVNAILAETSTPATAYGQFTDTFSLSFSRPSFVSFPSEILRFEPRIPSILCFKPSFAFEKLSSPIFNGYTVSFDEITIDRTMILFLG